MSECSVDVARLVAIDAAAVALVTDGTSTTRTSVDEDESIVLDELVSSINDLASIAVPLAGGHAVAACQRRLMELMGVGYASHLLSDHGPDPDAWHPTDPFLTLTDDAAASIAAQLQLLLDGHPFEWVQAYAQAVRL